MIFVAPVVGKTISMLISSAFGAMLNVREAEILDYCQKLGEVYVGYIDDELVCCWGLIPPSFISMQAYLWMWASPNLREHQFLFVRNSQRQVEAMLERYPTIVGHCKVGNDRAIRWLRWLGAEFSEAVDGNLSFTIQKRERQWLIQQR